MTDCSDLAAALSPRKGKQLQGGKGSTGPTSTHSRKGAQSQRLIHVTALDPRRTDKNGAGFLDTVSGSGGGWVLSLLWNRLGWSWGVSYLAKLDNIFNKDLFPSPPTFFVLCLCSAADGQIPL